MKTRTRVLAGIAGIVTAGALAVLPASGAFAACTPGGTTSNPTCSTNVTGNITVPTSITVSTDTGSFALTAPPGGQTVTPGPGGGAFDVTASVSTNDAAGYTMTENFASAAGFAGTHSGTGTDAIDPSEVTPYVYPTGPGSGTFAGSPFSGSSPMTVATQTHATPTSDAYPLAWSFILPGNQQGDTYTGTIVLTAIAS